MSEAAWLTSTEATAMLRLIPAIASARKFRLLSCGCARPLSRFVIEIDANQILDAAERVADNTVDTDSWHDAHNIAADYRDHSTDFDNALGTLLDATLDVDPRVGAGVAIESLLRCELDLGGGISDSCVLLREIFGNPFRPIDFAPWRTDTAVSLARQMYESREFGAMPILADALQDAGCDNEDVLTHCRDAKQLHVRGCWVVDGVLGLE